MNSNSLIVLSPQQAEAMLGASVDRIIAEYNQKLIEAQSRERWITLDELARRMSLSEPVVRRWPLPRYEEGAKIVRIKWGDALDYVASKSRINKK
ncbi:hypothetical protein [Spirosoma sordidisoli]|uniref:DNA-binding protein n=1 Tax=Spirosoma sordidisoli TaxID=2502893 RepID=A0A4Q2UJK6_9BACT|nr:hypothetical protein [Spirosoma sordidisoli]RYC69677.1 hypothetical protein EQG79_13835 [Spirosoma sordidisoli]